MQDNLAQKIALCEQAEAVNMSDDWRRTTDQLIHFKSNGRDPDPYPEENRRKPSGNVSVLHVMYSLPAKPSIFPNWNLLLKTMAKKELCAELEAFLIPHRLTTFKAQDFQARWNQIGFVPIKEKMPFRVNIKI